MKTIQNISTKLERQLIRAFAMLDAWFDTDEAAENNAVQEILESTILGNRIFLSKARFGKRSSVAVELTPEELERRLLASPCGDSTAGDISDVLGVEARTESFVSGRLTQGMRRELRNQLEACLRQLDQMRDEEEMNDRITAVKCLLNLDVYQYIYCIIQITRRNTGKLLEL